MCSALTAAIKRQQRLHQASQPSWSRPDPSAGGGTACSNNVGANSHGISTATLTMHMCVPEDSASDHSLRPPSEAPPHATHAPLTAAQLDAQYPVFNLPGSVELEEPNELEREQATAHALLAAKVSAARSQLVTH